MTNGSGSGGFANRLKFLLGAGALWIVLLAAWFLLVDIFSIAELVAGIVAASAAVVAATLAYEQGVLQMRPKASMLAGVGRSVSRVPVDLTLLARELLRALFGRHREGRLHGVELVVPRSPTGDARRAAIELIGSIAPNTIVLGVDERRVIVHQLVERAAERNSLREVGS